MTPDFHTPAPRVVELPDRAAVLAARERIRPFVTHTPLVRFHAGNGRPDIYLKLESVQPIGAFKIRGAANAMLIAGDAACTRGVYTASAGNMAQGVAYTARMLGYPCTVVVPDRAPRIKTDALEQLGARVIRVPFDAWWRAMVEHGYPGLDGVFVHPFEDTHVIAGNATIALELEEDLAALPGPSARHGTSHEAGHGTSHEAGHSTSHEAGRDPSGAAVALPRLTLDAVLCPWGGGGMACALGAMFAQTATRVIPVEVEGAAPLSASHAAGKAVSIDPAHSFVDGMGGKSVFHTMWPHAVATLDRPIVVSVADIADAVRTLARHARIVAEGAGAAPLAAARSAAGRSALAGAQRIVCVVSGGNIEHGTLARILAGELP